MDSNRAISPHGSVEADSAAPFRVPGRRPAGRRLRDDQGPRRQAVASARGSGVRDRPRMRAPGRGADGQARADNARQIDRLLAGSTTPPCARRRGPARRRSASPSPAARCSAAASPCRGRSSAARGTSTRATRPAESDGYRPPVMARGAAAAVGQPGGRPGAGATACSPACRRNAPAPRDPLLRHRGHAGRRGRGVRKAGAEGNDFVLGPLGRDEVGPPVLPASLPVPVLALNRGTTAPPAGSASFPLSPKDEGVGAADFLIARDARRVLVVAGRDDAARRRRVRRTPGRARRRRGRQIVWASRRRPLGSAWPRRRRTAASKPCSWR